MGEDFLKILAACLDLIEQFLVPQRYLLGVFSRNPNFGRAAMWVLGISATVFLIGSTIYVISMFFSRVNIDFGEFIVSLGSGCWLIFGLLILLNCLCLCVSINVQSPRFPILGDVDSLKLNFYRMTEPFLLISKLGTVYGAFALGKWSCRNIANLIGFLTALSISFIVSLLLALRGQLISIVAIGMLVASCVSFFFDIGNLLLTTDKFESDIELIGAGIALLGLTGGVGLAYVSEPETVRILDQSSDIYTMINLFLINYSFSIGLA
jgi:hypothetical protein